ncbi:hypothetical protein [Mycobacterium tuberculosis]|uniref:hypothetical protein n=1 Tax=Mycobacterium tuberculosis TaxID=1773 RepID=UPI00272CFFBC|nr:hypothetical protein [Mycobacterium tuberculosis]
MPFPGDVDVVLASELMEAGRAIQRGFVSPDRTTFIASSHRVYSMTEAAMTRPGRSFNVAILAMGGEGGGVLADWLVSLADQMSIRGNRAQSILSPPRRWR